MLSCSTLGKRRFKQRSIGLSLLLLSQDERLRLLPHVLLGRLLRRSFQVAREGLGELIGELGVARELIGERVVVGGLGSRIRRKVEESRVRLRLLVAAVVVHEPAEVGSELRTKGAIGIDVHGLSLLVQQVILAAFDVVAAWISEYEYLCGCWEKMRLR